MTEGSDVVCKKCNSIYFKSVVKVRKISAIISSDGKEHMIPIPTLVCLHCNLEIGAEEKGET